MTTREIESLFDVPPPEPGRVRRYLVAALSLLALGVIVTVAVVARSGAEALAELRVRDGSVQLARESQPVQDAVEGEDLRAGDAIRTDAAGRAQVDLFDGSLVRLHSASELTLRRLDRSEGEGRDIELAVGGGRAWYRVSDRLDGPFRVAVSGGVVKVEGTSFLVDCVQMPTCFVVGFDGEADVSGATGSSELGPGACVRVDETGGLSDCDERALGLIDDWVRENLAEDEQLEIAEGRADGTPSPTPTTSSTQAPVRGPAGPSRTTAPTPAPTRTERPEPTVTPKPTIPPVPQPPQRTRKPAPTSTPSATSTPGGGSGTPKPPTPTPASS